MVHQYLLASVIDNRHWVQRQNSTTPASGTTVMINDTAPTTDRYNLTLAEILAPATAVPTITATLGTPQSATVTATFATALQATVKDSSGNLLSGAPVTFTAPATTGASGTFGGSATATVSTGTTGVATALAVHGGYVGRHLYGDGHHFRSDLSCQFQPHEYGGPPDERRGDGGSFAKRDYQDGLYHRAASDGERWQQQSRERRVGRLCRPGHGRKRNIFQRHGNDHGGVQRGRCGLSRVHCQCGGGRTLLGDGHCFRVDAGKLQPHE